jgi:hypothetical protein
MSVTVSICRDSSVSMTALVRTLTRRSTARRGREKSGI